MNEQNTPLHDKDAERAVLGALLIDNTVLSRISPILGETTDAFFTVDHQIIYAAILAVYEEKQTCDILVVADHLNKRDELNRCGGSVYLYDLQARIAETENSEFHALIVRDKAVRRRLAGSGKHITEIAFDEEKDLTHVIDEAQQEVLELGKIENKKGLRHAGGIVNDTIKELGRLAEEGITTPGLATGFTDLDILTTGFYPGEVAIIAARPNGGKTSFALNVALNVALNDDANDTVAYFSLEMPARQLGLRILSAETSIPFSRLRTSDIKDTEWSTIVEVSTILMEHSHRIHLCDDFGIDVSGIRQECRRLASKVDNLALIVVDYIQQVPSKEGDNREQKVASVSKALKALSGELDTVVIACCQLNREVERQNRKPVLADLRESGAIEQDADFVGFLHNENELPNQQESEIDLLVRKQRNGATGDVPLKFYGPIMRFGNQKV